MAFSLIPPTRTPRGLLATELELGELNCVSHLSKNRPLLIRVEQADLNAGLDEQLDHEGFTRGPNNIAQCLNTASFSSMEQYLRSLSERDRWYVRKCVKNFQEAGGTWKITKASDVSANDFSQFYSGVFFPACSYRSINPYEALYAHKFQQFLSSLKESSYFLELRLEGEMVAGGFWSIAPLIEVIRGRTHDPKSVGFYWNADIDLRNQALNFQIAHSHPTKGGPKLSQMITTVIFYLVIEWAIGAKVPILTCLEDRSYLPDPYLGVVAFKKKFGMTTALIYLEDVRLYLRLAQELFFGTRCNVFHPFLNKEAKHVARYVLGGSALSSTVRLLLSSDEHLKKEIILMSLQEKEAIQKLCLERKVPAAITRWNSEENHV
jgi:hypothetical protein